MKSTIGRPRALTDEEVARVLAWHDAFKAVSAQRKALGTLRQLATELGVPRSTLYDAIRRGGEFKLPSAQRERGELRTRQARALRKARMKAQANSEKL